jgi:Ni/Fe-hydrogenase subunit HybB-like protein
MMTCNVISPRCSGSSSWRHHLGFTFFMSIIVNIGMWFERFVIIVTSLHRDYLPSSWNMFHPTWVDVGIFLGTIGIFFTLYLLFARFFPVLALQRGEVHPEGSSGESYKNEAAKHHHH